jgi:hypothetical protein
MKDGRAPMVDYSGQKWIEVYQKALRELEWAESPARVDLFRKTVDRLIPPDVSHCDCAHAFAIRGMFSPTKSELHREKAELLEKNARFAEGP